MPKMVGLSRNLKLPWLNEAARLYAEGLDADQIKEQLNGMREIFNDICGRLSKEYMKQPGKDPDIEK